MDIGEKIRLRRLELHMSQKALGNLVCVSSVSISALERGERSLKFEDIPLFAKALQVPVEWFTEEIEEQFDSTSFSSVGSSGGSFSSIGSVAPDSITEPDSEKPLRSDSKRHPSGLNGIQPSTTRKGARKPPRKLNRLIKELKNVMSKYDDDDESEIMIME